ncbi:hypothetical protein ACTXG6_05160 [Pseudonocardia sp. Cha107L01]|uniref:hypothetical protein n=1 Tax=Pseudonocardia sp. Cha107L01 TaxID=3457576 RepID=UPI00403E69F9
MQVNKRSRDERGRPRFTRRLPLAKSQLELPPGTDQVVIEQQHAPQHLPSQRVRIPGD